MPIRVDVLVQVKRILDGQKIEPSEEDVNVQTLESTQRISSKVIKPPSGKVNHYVFIS